MMQKLRVFLIVLSISLTGYAQVANSPGVYQVCDDELNDGLAVFDLTFLDSQVLGNQNPADFTVTYHETAADADNGVNPLPSFYTNTSNPQTIYIRVTDTSSGNFDTTTVDLVVLQPPTPALPTPLIACDFDGDGFAEFDLESKTIEIINGEQDVFVNYHETEIDALNGTATIVSTYMNVIPNMQTVYARVESLANSCFTIVPLELIVDNGPEINPPLDYVICETDANGTETIVVTDMVNSIFDFTNPDFALNIYESEADAANMVNPIFDTFTNSSNPQTLYYNIEDASTGCITTGFFNMTIVGCNDDADMDTVSNTTEDETGDGNLASSDTDFDGLPNYIDNDDDGDGVLTADEDYNGNGDPTDDDTNMNNIPDYLDADVALSLTEAAFNAFKLYPNPASNKLYVETATVNETLEYTINNLAGQVVLKSSLTSETLKQVDISSLTPGLYFVTLSSGRLETTKKLLVQ